MGNEYAVYEVKKEENNASLRANTKNSGVRMKFWGVKCDKKTFFSKFTYRIRRKYFAFKRDEDRLSRIYKNDVAFFKTFEYPDMLITSVNSLLNDELPLDEDIVLNNSFSRTIKPFFYDCESNEKKSLLFEVPYLATGISVGESVSSQFKNKEKFQTAFCKHQHISNDLANSVRFCVVEKFSSDESIKSALTDLYERSSVIDDSLEHTLVKELYDKRSTNRSDANSGKSTTSSNTITDSELSLLINDITSTGQIYHSAPKCGFVDYEEVFDKCSQFENISDIVEPDTNHEFDCEIDLQGVKRSRIVTESMHNNKASLADRDLHSSSVKITNGNKVYFQIECSKNSENGFYSLSNSKNALFMDNRLYTDVITDSTYDVLDNFSQLKMLKSLPIMEISPLKLDNTNNSQIEVESIYSNVSHSCISLPIEREGDNSDKILLESINNDADIKINKELLCCLNQTHSLPDLSTNGLKWNYTLFELDKLISKIKHSGNITQSEFNDILLDKDNKVTDDISMRHYKHDYLSQAIENELKRIRVLLRLNKTIIGQTKRGIKNATNSKTMSRNNAVKTVSAPHVIHVNSKKLVSAAEESEKELFVLADLNENLRHSCNVKNGKLDSRNRSFSLEDVSRKLFVSQNICKPKVISIEVSNSYNGIGAYIASNAETRRGHFVKMVEDGSPSSIAGLKEGHCLIEINGKNVEMLDFYDVIDILKTSIAKGSVQLSVIDCEDYISYKKQKACINSSLSMNENIQDAGKTEKSNTAASFSMQAKLNEQNNKRRMKPSSRSSEARSQSFTLPPVINPGISAFDNESDSVVYEEPHMIPDSNNYERLCDQLSVRHSVIINSDMKEFGRKKLNSINNTNITSAQKFGSKKCSLSPYFFSGTPI